MTRTRFAITTVIVSLSVLPATAVFAQQLALEEIVVTARKVEENLMEVPLAVTAFSAEQLESIDMAQLTDIQLFTPSFSFTDQAGQSGRNDRSSNALVFRGLYLNVNVGITAGGLLFIDGAPVVGGYSPSIVDTERVEILKGPQSAYFGRSTFVGAVNFVMKEPDNEFRGRVSADFAKFGSNEQHVMLEGPIVKDKLSVRVSGRHWKQGGYIEIFANRGSTLAVAPPTPFRRPSCSHRPIDGKRNCSSTTLKTTISPARNSPLSRIPTMAAPTRTAPAIL